MKTNKFVVRTESDEILYECPECQHSFAAFTVICDSKCKQTPDYCVYCGAEMDTDDTNKDVPFMKPGDEDDDKPDMSNQKKK